MLTLLTNLFPVWVLVALVFGLAEPAAFTWFTPYVTPGLAVIMLGMGLTLTTADFAVVLKTPQAALIGLAAQFGIMPVLGWAIVTGFGLPRDYAVGLILVACCPGGTASNVVTYLARANVALSVLMTLASTVAAVVLTPALTSGLAGTLVDVDTFGLLRSILMGVLLPLAFGLLLRELLPGLVRRVLPVAPVVSVLTIALIVGAIVGANAGPLLESGPRLVVALVTLHAGGFALGYVAGRLVGFPERDRRTLSIEVGMQNSGLGTVLAKAHFAPATAVPCAISAVIHSVVGSLLAGVWRAFPPAAPETAHADL